MSTQYDAIVVGAGHNGLTSPIPDRIYAPHSGDGLLPIPGGECLPVWLGEPPGTRRVGGSGEKRRPLQGVVSFPLALPQR